VPHVLVLFIDIAQPEAASSDIASTDPCEDRAESCARCSDVRVTDRTERHLRMLQELAEIGMDLARAVRRQALEQAAAEPAGIDQTSTIERAGTTERVGGDLGLVFSRIARAVRQTVALESKIEEERRARDQRAEAEQAQRAATIARERKARQKARVKRIVEQAIDAEADGSDREDLLGDLDERLEDADLDADLAERPIGEIVARICRDLGIPLDWSRWEDEAWALEEGGAIDEPGATEENRATEEVRTKPPNSPFAPRWPAPAGTDRSPEPHPPRAAATGSDPPSISGI
jgi:hypothetical protein